MNEKSLASTEMLRAQLESYANDFGKIAAAHQTLQSQFERMQNALAFVNSRHKRDSGPAKGAKSSREMVLALIRWLNEDKPLSLHYQPQIQAGRGKIVAVEALLHLQHSQYGNVPNEFIISVAEECGLINALDLRVLRQAARQLRKWRELGLSVRLAVNVSVQTLCTPGVAWTITNLLEREDLPAALLELEVTESVTDVSGGVLMENLQALRKAGVGLAIDDFGTGFSNIARLRDLPFTRMKIDRSFIRDMTNTSEDMQLVKGIISMSQALGLHTVAEGVEHLDQLNALCRLGCEEIQGNLFCSSLSAGDMTALLQQNSLFAQPAQPSREILNLINYSAA